MAELRRVLGPFDATCVVIGSIVGVGIFYTPSDVVRLTGSGELALLAWTIGGFIALCGAYTFAEIGGMYPRTAGQYEVLRETYGNLPSYLFVTCNATILIPGSASIMAVLCAQNMGIVIHGAPPEQPALVVPALLLVAGLATVNAIGVRWGASVQNATVVAKVLVLVAVAAVAAFMGEARIGGRLPAEDTARLVPVMGVMAALVPCFFSYGGWQGVLWIGGEVRDPRRNLPRAITGGVFIVIAVYLLANWAYLHLLGPAGVASSRALAADAVAQGWPRAGARIVAAGVAISSFGVLNVQFLTGPRLLQGLARTGQLPRLVGTISASRGTPIVAILAIAAAALTILVGAALRTDDPSRTLGYLTNGLVFVDGGFFALTGAAVMIMRHRKPHADRPVRAPLYPWVPGLFVLGEVAIVVGAYFDDATREAALFGLAWVFLLSVVWLLTGRRA